MVESRATRFWGLTQMRYTFLVLSLLATFVEKWHGDTRSFHMPCGEMTVMLDDVRFLVHLSIQGRLLNHTGISLLGHRC
jgi:hypothetical protein